MDIQKLYDLADREIRLGTFDRTIMAKAKIESGGVQAVAHQKYWELRAAKIREDAKGFPGVSQDLYLRELTVRLNKEEGARRLRANLVGWIWVIVCFACLCGSFVFFWAARGAFIKGSDAQYGYGIAGIVWIAVAVVAFVITKRDAGQDPFAD